MTKPKTETVKFISLKEARDAFSTLVSEAQEGTTIGILKNGKLAAILIGAGSKSIEDLVREADRAV